MLLLSVVNNSVLIQFGVTVGGSSFEGKWFSLPISFSNVNYSLICGIHGRTDLNIFCHEGQDYRNVGSCAVTSGYGQTTFYPYRIRWIAIGY